MRRGKTNKTRRMRTACWGNLHGNMINVKEERIRPNVLAAALLGLLEFPSLISQFSII